MKSNFKVTLIGNKSDEVIGMLCYLFFFVAMYIGAFMDLHWFYTACAIGWTLLGIAAIIAIKLFYVKVNGTHIQARTRTGKKYEFEASEIKKVTCYRTFHLKHGPQFYLDIKAKSEELHLHLNMRGIEEMAGYLIQMHESGVINKQAVSAKCKEELVLYRDRFYKKEDSKASLVLLIALLLIAIGLMGAYFF